MSWVHIATALIVMAGAIVGGSRTQKATRFIYPSDFITFLLIFFISADLLLIPMVGAMIGVSLPTTGVDPWILHLPLLAGYFLGYYINGMQTCTMLEYRDPTTGAPIRDYRVFYVNKEGKLCIADNSNLALLNRWCYNLHHLVDCPNRGNLLGRDKKAVSRRPYWPTFEDKLTWVNKFVDLPDVIVPGRFFSHRQKKSLLVVAVGHQMESWQLAFKEDSLDRLNETIADLDRQLQDYKDRELAKITEGTAVLVSGIKSAKPINNYFDVLRRREAERTREEEDRILKQQEATVSAQKTNVQK